MAKDAPVLLTPMALNTSAEEVRYFGDLLSAFEADAFVLGSGVYHHGLGLETKYVGCFNLPPKFVTEYIVKHRSHDAVAAIISTATPGAIAYCPCDYRQERSPKEVKAIGEYLRNYGVLAFMVVGIRTSAGFSWMTIYRCRERRAAWHDPIGGAPGVEEEEALSRAEEARRFTAADRERAAFHLRAKLFDWQQKNNQPPARVATDDRPLLRALLRQTLPRVEALLLQAMGYSFTTIASRLNRATAGAASDLRKHALRALAEEGGCGSMEGAEVKLRFALFAPGAEEENELAFNDDDEP